ncbi:hypothetical protein MSAN_01691400 [Mycena sanguinolenta]|uniref:CCHC-type domain-containing protein n=1 Tax=Mycena sanguinolenta TaxID=230812 RepID=A0A8H6XWQ8_9AGAR|nr:hypothetical protein MSAN_01691400 [Mycena sanguinolenta]
MSAIRTGFALPTSFTPPRANRPGSGRFPENRGGPLQPGREGFREYHFTQSSSFQQRGHQEEMDRSTFSSGHRFAASNWAPNWRCREMHFGELDDSYTFEEPMKELEKTSKDMNVKRLAHWRLMMTEQGKAPLADFIQAFKLNVEEAGYEPGNPTCDTLLVNLLETLITDEVRHVLYTGGIEIPNDHRSLKQRLVTIGGVLERKKLRAAQVAKGRNPFWVPAKTDGQKPSGRKPGGTPNLSRKGSPGEVTSMDMDRSWQVPTIKCYNCGKKGHKKNACLEPPKKKFNIWSFQTELYSQEDLQALAAIFREKGF